MEPVATGTADAGDDWSSADVRCGGGSSRSTARRRTKRAKSSGIAEGSIVATVDKAAVLAMVEQLEAEAAVEEERKQQVLAHPQGSALLCAHDENVAQWTKAIAQRLQAAFPERVSFAQLCERLEMRQVEVWLAVLLGEFKLEQEGEFYDSPIWVRQWNKERTV